MSGGPRHLAIPCLLLSAALATGAARQVEPPPSEPAADRVSPNDAQDPGRPLRRPRPAPAPTWSEERPVSCRTPWCRPSGPITVSVDDRGSADPLSLLVLDRTGATLAEVSVVAGSMDLLALVPAIRDSERTLWLQLMEGDRPVGQPLWITPMRASPPVRTVRSVRPSNRQPYTRVVGWGDRAIDPADAETVQAMAQWTPADPVVTGGYRVEPAVDAILHTSEGRLRVALAPDAAPATVDNFLRLARAGFYDGTTFHRVVPLDRDGRPFVVQGGDPTGTGDGGPGWNLVLEPSDLPHDRGVLGMARGDDPDSGGSQFYISLSREGTARLDGQYCTFGRLLEGWKALDAIAASPVGDQASGRPKEPPVLQRVELVPASPRTPATRVPETDLVTPPQVRPER